MTVFAYLPSMSETMEEATIIEWHVMEGETVERGQLLYTIETEKASFEITAPDSGTVLQIVASENCTVQVGAVVAVIGDPDEVFDLPMQSTRHPSVATVAKDPVTSLDIPNHRIKASPVAKSLASKLGINLSEIDGTTTISRGCLKLRMVVFLVAQETEDLFLERSQIRSHLPHKSCAVNMC